MRRLPPRIGIAWGNHGISPICGLLKDLECEPLSSASRALWPGGFGFRRTGLWARPRPGALGGALVMPRKIWSGPVLPPPKFPGVAMESCLCLAYGILGDDSDFFALLGSAPQELNTVRPEAKLTR